MWLKYASGPIQLDPTRTYSQDGLNHHNAIGKPNGCWFSDDSDYGWKDSCRDNKFSLDRLTHVHELVLDEPRFLIIRSVEQFDEFNGAFGWQMPDEPLIERVRAGKGMFFDWGPVAAQYAGIIITPYIWERRLGGSHTIWYYGWDCASGCVWDLSAVLDFRLIRVEEAQPNENPNAVESGAPTTP